MGVCWVWGMAGGKRDEARDQKESMRLGGKGMGGAGRTGIRGAAGDGGSGVLVVGCGEVCVSGTWAREWGGGRRIGEMCVVLSGKSQGKENGI